MSVQPATAAAPAPAPAAASAAKQSNKPQTQKWTETEFKEMKVLIEEEKYLDTWSGKISKIENTVAWFFARAAYILGSIVTASLLYTWFDAPASVTDEEVKTRLEAKVKAEEAEAAKKAEKKDKAAQARAVKIAKAKEAAKSAADKAAKEAQAAADKAAKEAQAAAENKLKTQPTKNGSVAIDAVRGAWSKLPQSVQTAAVVLAAPHVVAFLASVPAMLQSTQVEEGAA